MNLSSFLAPADVFCSLALGSKRQALETLANHAAGQLGLAPEAVLHALVERERLGSTALGAGVALPHARLTEIQHPFGIFAHLSQPIGFDAADTRPVDLIFLLLAPAAANAEHLKALARVAQLFRDKQKVRLLREAESAPALYALLMEGEEE